MLTLCNRPDSEPEKENKKEVDAETIAAQQRETVPIEERIVRFKDMLAEKDVSYAYTRKFSLNNNILFFRLVHFRPGRRSSTKLSLIRGIYY